MSRWTVKPAAAEDFDAIVAIEAAAFRAQSWGAKSVREGLSAPLVSALLAFRDGAAAPDAFALWRTLGREGEILSLAVAPARRRMGAADALVEAMLKDASADGLEAMFLEVEDANAPARALYAKHGFRQVGRRRGYYRNGHDALVLRRDLQIGAGDGAR